MLAEQAADWFQTVSPIEAMRFVRPIAQTTAVLFQRAGFSVRDIAQTHDSVVYGMNAHGPIEILGGESSLR